MSIRRIGSYIIITAILYGLWWLHNYSPLAAAVVAAVILRWVLDQIGYDILDAHHISLESAASMVVSMYKQTVDPLAERVQRLEERDPGSDSEGPFLN